MVIQRFIARSRVRDIVCCCAALVLASGCTQFDPEEPNHAYFSETRLQAIEQQINDHIAHVVKEEKYLASLSSGNNWWYLGPLSKKENWQGKIDLARAKIEQARRVYYDKLRPQLKWYSPFSQELYSYPGVILSHLIDARYHATWPRLRVQRVEQVGTDLAGFANRARIDYEKIVSINRSVQAAAARAVGKFPAYKEDKNQLYQLFVQMTDSATVNYENVKSEFDNYKRKSETDIASLADNAAELAEISRLLSERQADLYAELKSLEQQEYKILVDMKHNYKVRVAREQWCTGLLEFLNTITLGDYCEESYEIRDWTELDEVDYVSVLRDADIDVSYDGYIAGKTSSLRTVYGDWDRPKIFRSNYTGYVLHDAKIDGYHKYLILESGSKPRVSDWIAVDWDTYEKHLDHLGMVVYAKPEGKTRNNVDPFSYPPCFVYMKEPDVQNGQPVGANEHGQWVTRAGASYWEYNGKTGPGKEFQGAENTCSYDDYKGYRENRGVRHYYGVHHYWGTYGSRTYGYGRVVGGEFVRRNGGVVQGAKSGTRTRGPMTTSVRGLGTAFRNRGPGFGK
ncbi:MAG: hypothetical protein OEZ10_00765 [Gammaproteobacteria bacterium]|nr:hypothetical protein [Gammaproteobacteria bacterium]